jgi:AmiR/NasT family two-component response regulator
MVTEGCTVEQAQGLMRQAAVADERTLLQIAHRIIEQHNSSR